MYSRSEVGSATSTEMERRMNQRMMYMGIIELTGDPGKANEISELIDKEREQFPDRYPKQPRLQDGSIAQFMLGSNNKAFSLYETDNPDQLLRLAQRYRGVATMKFVPLFQI